MKKSNFQWWIGIRQKIALPVFHKMIFMGMGIGATLWFLYRVIPKPSRAAYPCMRAAAPFMSAFVLYLVSLTGAAGAWMKTKTFFRNKKYGLAFAGAVVTLLLVLFTASQSGEKVFARTRAFFLPPRMMVAQNMPEGKGKGIFPGRVVWTHVPGVANWDGKTGFWFDDRWNPQDKTDQLLKSTLVALTDKKNAKNAWKALFIYFNQTHQRGNRGYIPGEKIAVKINQNNTYSHQNSEEINASPQLTLSLLRSLVNEAGIPQENITVFDASRYITDNLFNKCHDEFPGVNYVDHYGGDGRIKATFKDDAIPYSEDNERLARGLATCATEADYLIDMALLKGHVGQGVTLCAKNWYGATSIESDWRKNAHNNFNQDRNGKPKYMTFTDFMGHKDMGGKTMLFLIDGIYGSKLVNGIPSPKWQTAPFNGNWPCSLLASQDGVAIDAVGIDFLTSEWPDLVDINYADAYLQESALAGNPPSGTHYDPEKDGTGLSGLGVLEHWNNASQKQYSRNLGKSEGIELVAVEK